MTGGGPIRGDAIANPIDSRNATDEREWISANVGASGFRADVQAGPHAFIADEPIPLGGTGLGPTPYELLLGALSSCMRSTHMRLASPRFQRGAAVSASQPGQPISRCSCINVMPSALAGQGPVTVSTFFVIRDPPCSEKASPGAGGQPDHVTGLHFL